MIAKTEPRTTRLGGLSPRKAVLLLVAVLAAGVAVLGPGGGPRPAGTGPEVLRYVADQRRDLGVPGLGVAVVQDGISATAGSGTASADTPFILGSATKSFTALAVMQLVEGGRVSLDDPVVRHVAGFRTANPTASARITVRQLLTHTSGLTPSAGEQPFTRRETSLAQQVRDLDRTTAEAPGTFRYSNANYEVLGELVERVSGQTYGDYLQQHVLGPLEMRHSYTDLASARAGQLGAGHKIWFGLPVSNGVYYRADFLPAGFLVSTPDDLVHYVTALLDGGTYRGRRVLSARGVATMLAPSVDAAARGRGRTYGFGWYQETVKGSTLVYVPGSAHNTHATIALNLARRSGVAVTSDAESTLYYVVPKLDLVALNAVTLAGGGRTQGTLRGLYVVFDACIALALFFYSRNLVQVVRRRTRGFAGRSRFATARGVWRELISPTVVLLGLPRYLGFGWPVLLRSDVGVAAACVAGLGLTTLALRLGFAAARHGERQDDRGPVEPRRRSEGSRRRQAAPSTAS